MAGRSTTPPPLTDDAVEWAAGRGLSRATLEALGVASGTAFFPDAGTKLPAVYFRYPEGWKARSYPDKHHVAGKGLKLAFWNIERVLRAAPQRVFITEGEFDALALVEAGIPASQVLSVPNGAKSKPQDDPAQSKGYGFVDEALKSGLGKVRRFIWCGDSDEQGLALRQDMVRLLGAARFFFVDWPEGCKDANDVLRAEGPEFLRELVTEGCLPWPVAGLYRMNELPEPPPIKPWDVGFAGWEDRLRLAPRMISVVTGHPGHGKALALDTPIPTPSGWTTMGAIKPGDVIFDEQGEQCRVILATPIMFGRDCYRLVFDDGSEFIADADHLWLTETEAARQSERAAKRRGDGPLKPKGSDQSHKRVLPAVVDTRHIASTLVANGKTNHAVRLSEPVQCQPDDSLPIPPYTLGVWLGDGSSAGANVTCDDRDAQIMELVAAEGVPVIRQERGDRTTNWSLSDGVKSPHKDSIKGRLIALGVLGNKHIPMRYKRAGILQRRALLQGLMDTDGHYSNGAAEFCTTSRQLADDVYDLVCSLGIRTKLDECRSTLYGRDCGPKFRIRFTTTHPVFRLDRKAAAQASAVGRRKYRYIVACDRVASVPVRCIQVDSPSRLYLAGKSFIATHNTALMTQIWRQVVQRYDLVACVASFETRAKPHLRRHLRALHAGTAEKYLTPEDMAAADAWINDHYLFLVHPDQRPTLEWFLDMAEVAVVRHGAKIVQLDPWNRLEGMKAPGERETDYIGRCLRTIHQFAQDLNCHVQILAHPAKMENSRRGTPPMLEDISDSKNWDNMVDQGLVVHRPKIFDGGARCTHACLYQRKARFEEIGYPCKLDLDFSIEKQRYSPVAEKAAAASDQGEVPF